MSSELRDEVRRVVGDEPADVNIVKSVIKLILQYTGEVSSDDVRFYISRFNPSTMIIGNAFRSLVANGILEKNGTKKTDLKSSKSRDIAVYSAPK
jgi:hypothetical protein